MKTKHFFLIITSFFLFFLLSLPLITYSQQNNKTIPKTKKFILFLKEAK